MNFHVIIEIPRGVNYPGFSHLPEIESFVSSDRERKTLSDRAFYKEYHKLVGEDPTPLLPEANEKAIREIPRDPETIGLFKKFVGPGPLPPR
jgi:hypothetical protein